MRWNWVYGATLVVVLGVLWLVLSGFWYKPLLVGFGVLAVIIALVLTVRMGLLDDESAPFSQIISFARYWVWLGAEIVKANIYVVKVSLKPDLDIQPVLIRVPVTARSGLGRATFANSITLTPGTVTLAVEEDAFLVHSLTEELADPAAFADMGERVNIAAHESEKA
ncbi:Na+/H+ antiporter subunit E [Woodsholea maritima]|uniref:Na+/H+ antiporter subunit E n=1 Tax=Woodsholea maritima TaxID=240237 RepID=UPI00035EEFD0|nr:Na+/H+ antiporter subunit E [Woodsholea maritima]